MTMVSDHTSRYKLFHSYRPHRKVTTLLLLPNLQHYVSYSCDKIISVRVCRQCACCIELLILGEASRGHRRSPSSRRCHKSRTRGNYGIKLLKIINGLHLLLVSKNMFRLYWFKLLEKSQSNRGKV